MSKYLLENGAQIDVCSKGDLSTVWYATIQNEIKALLSTIGKWCSGGSTI